MCIEQRCALLNLFSICSVSRCSLEVRGSQWGGTWAVNLPSPSLLHFKVLTPHLEITNSASQTENEKTLPCFEEIDPRRWQAGCQPACLWYCYGSVFFFFYHIMKGTPLDPLLRVNNPSPQCCHRADGYLDIVLCKREKVVCSNISECGWDVTQFFLFVVFIPKLSSFRAKHLGCE